MKALPSTHPHVHQQLKNGQFSVQRSRTAFSNVAVDQAIEQTLNRDTKTKGGIVGFGRNPAAVEKWMVNAHHRPVKVYAVYRTSWAFSLPKDYLPLPKAKLFTCLNAGIVKTSM